jgi:arylsulfatase A-like enzyme
LSFVPTILDLIGMQTEASKLPGRPIQEVLPGQSPNITH